METCNLSSQSEVVIIGVTRKEREDSKYDLGKILEQPLSSYQMYQEVETHKWFPRLWEKTWCDVNMKVGWYLD
jgi:hypothetical protein